MAFATRNHFAQLNVLGLHPLQEIRQNRHAVLAKVITAHADSLEVQVLVLAQGFEHHLTTFLAEAAVVDAKLLKCRVFLDEQCKGPSAIDIKEIIRQVYVRNLLVDGGQQNRSDAEAQISAVLVAYSVAEVDLLQVVHIAHDFISKPVVAAQAPGVRVVLQPSDLTQFHTVTEALNFVVCIIVEELVFVGGDFEEFVLSVAAHVNRAERSDTVEAVKRISEQVVQLHLHTRQVDVRVGSGHDAGEVPAHRRVGESARGLERDF